MVQEELKEQLKGNRIMNQEIIKEISNNKILFVRRLVCMIDDKLFLTPEEILNKEFKIDARGYRMQEVDKFLDMVIRDYTEFLRTIKKLEKDNLDLIEDNKKLQMEYRKLKSAISASSEGASANVDVLRRLSNLEKIVYGKDN